jgi:hypothetical protein
MSFTGITCCYCNISAKDSYRAFFIRLFPGGEYLIMCDSCLARERRYLDAERPEPEGASSSASLVEESALRLTGSIGNALLAAAHRSIENFSLPKIHGWPIFSTLYRSYKRLS